MIKKQAGMTGTGWLTVLGLIGFFVYIGLTILPIQIEAYKVRSALENLNQVPNITKMSKNEIVKQLQGQFDIDDITHVTKDNIFIDKSKGVLTIRIEYEIRTKMIKPFDIVGVFKEKVKVIQH